MSPRAMALCALAALSAALAAAPVAAAERRCAIAQVSGGDADVWDGADWRAAVPGPLPAGLARLRTGRDSRIEVTCDDGLTVTVGVGALVDLQGLDVAGPEENILMRLARGILGVVAPRRTWGALEMAGPLAISAARATEWLGIAGPDGATAFFVREGLVAVTTPGAEVALEPGEGVDIDPAAGVGPVTVWGAERVAAAQAALGFGWR